MKSTSFSQEAAEDIFFGQIVIIWARWFLIAAGGVLTLLATQTTNEVMGAVYWMGILIALNFFIHARYLMGKPANQMLLAAAGGVDVFIITLLVWFWPGPTGIENHLYILYYPILFTFALVLPPALTVPFTLVTLAFYLGMCVWETPYILFSVTSIKVIGMRLVSLVAMSGLGMFYWRIQRERRRASARPEARTA